MGGDAKDPRERRGKGWGVILLSRIHQGRPRRKNTLTMISHGVEIASAGGETDRKAGYLCGFSLLFFFFLFKSYVR